MVKQWIGFGLAWAVMSSAGAVEVTLDWAYENLPAQMQIYNPAPQPVLPLWQTRTVSHAEDLPVGARLTENRFHLEPGERRQIVLVLANTGNEPLYFFAVPHLVLPVRNALGFKFRCLCVDYAYEVAAGAYWYRVVDFALDSGFEGRVLTLTHHLVGIARSRYEQYKVPADLAPNGPG